MSNYIFNPPQQNYHNNQKIDLGDIRVSVLTNIEVPEGVSQVIFNNNTIVDMSYDSVIPEVVHNGYTFHAANGNICTGTYDPIELPNYNLFIGINPSSFDDPLSNCNYRYTNLSASNMFNYYGIYMGDYVTNCYQMFNNARYYNKPVIIGNNVTNCCLMFNNCVVYNQPINIPDKVTNCSRMFQSCQGLNQPIIIGNNVTNCYLMFYFCYIFNQPVNIPDSVTSCYGIFNQCTGFNQPVTIGNNVIICSNMFSGCSNFNQPVNIPDKVTDCYQMFNGCNNLNQPVIIGKNVTNCANMFKSCVNFGVNIYIRSTKVTNAAYMLNGCSMYIKKNIFCRNLTPFTGTTGTTSITGFALTWTAMTNGFYNATYNINLYNNLPEDT